MQVALSVLLLGAGGLLVRSFFMLHRGPGFDPDAVVLVRLRPSLVGYTNERAWAFQREVDRAPRSAARRPRGESGERSGVPAGPTGHAGAASRGLVRSVARVSGGTTFVGPRYFKTLGVSVVEGREFDDRDARTVRA